MNTEQLNIMSNGKGFIAAIDQSGGSTPKALRAYGVEESDYNSPEEMFERVHQMRTRIMTSPNFTSDHIIGVILFKETMRSKIEGKYSADYLWDVKHIVPFLKVDNGLKEENHGVQLMKDIDNLDDLLNEAKNYRIFGTKMRSVILKDNPEGIKHIVQQQFELGKQIVNHGLLPILEPEVSIHAQNKASIEATLKANILEYLDTLDTDQQVMFKLTPPEEANFYQELVNDPRVVRVVFLSGGHSKEKANELLAQNNGVIASFSRGFTEGLHATQTEEEFNQTIATNAKTIYEASIT